MSTAAALTGRVLLVDDDPLVCGSLRRILEVDGLTVEVAASAPEALAICEKENFDLIILDYLARYERRSTRADSQSAFPIGPSL